MRQKILFYNFYLLFSQGCTVMHISASEGFICGIQHILMLRPDSVHDTDKMVIITLLQGLTLCIYTVHTCTCVLMILYIITQPLPLFSGKNAVTLCSCNGPCRYLLPVA